MNRIAILIFCALIFAGQYSIGMEREEALQSVQGHLAMIDLRVGQINKIMSNFQNRNLAFNDSIYAALLYKATYEYRASIDLHNMCIGYILLGSPCEIVDEDLPGNVEK